MNHSSFSVLAAAANDPAGYARHWKARTGGKVIGFMPMNFPAELVDAAGALPYQLQELNRGITRGNAIFPTFYCGFTRSVVDQAACGDLAMLDAFYFVDNCVQIIGAADVVRAKLDDLRTRYFQLDPSMKAGSSTRSTAERVFGQLQCELQEFTHQPVDDAAIRASIARYNEGRAMLREAHGLRQHSSLLTAADMQVLVKAGMVMDRTEFNDHLRNVMQALRGQTQALQPGPVRVHVSGHLCQAPKPELLDLIEDCGAQIVNDDLFHGWRHFATDVPGGDALNALVEWYFQRNNTTPCPTRTHTAHRFDAYLANAADQTHVEGVISLLVKFCEPHMYVVPEIVDTFKQRGIPHLLIETEHEGMPLESIRTRVESFVEGIRSRRAQLRGSRHHLVKENA